jgi:hypothetical protein
LIVVLLCWFKMSKAYNSGMHYFLGAYSLIQFMYTIFWILFAVYIVKEGVLSAIPSVMAAAAGVATKTPRLRDTNISEIFSSFFQ